MNKNVVLIMAGAVVIALTVAMIVQSMLAPSKKKPEGGPPTVQVLVADKALVKGEALDERDVRWQSWPESAIFTGAIIRQEDEDIEKLEEVGKRVRRSIDKGEPIMANMLISEGADVNIIAATLSPGMRAVSIPISASTSVGGFIKPGDHVDIILTYQVRVTGAGSEVARNTIQRYASQTILKNLKILAVDQEFKESRDTGVGKTVTVEVDQAGVETLALAREMGDLSLALRKYGEDADVAEARDVLTTDVHVSDVLQEIAEMRKRARVNSNTIRVYNGSAVQNISVRAP